MSKATYNAEIAAKRWHAGNIYEIIIECEQLAHDCRPGQFLQVDCGDGTFLRRPISIYNVDGARVSMIFEVRGRGTRYLSQLKAGEYLNVLGPLGNGFDTDIDGDILVIGGGLGVFPLYMVAKSKGKSCDAVLGYKTERVLVSHDRFADVCREVVITTDDGSYGVQGTAVAAAHSLVVNHHYKAIFACGPLPMLKAVHALACKYNIPAWVSLEERMACGFGVCLACAVKSRENEEEYLHVCKHGPVFNSKEVML
ncbi:MAG: dihydroorotate dehydrogenase electron transfer subunit [Clostridia bacterium]|nr:dihydroorotate dehydrogenase electron transfer subunit [Clostridia bacterium]